ncbi:MAG TPA: hypothetical protein VF516_39140, partial [Kofleriaceae bacterium]
ATGLAAAAAVLIALHDRRAVRQLSHLHELDRVCRAALADGARHDTSLGVAVSVHPLPDGRRDWVLSSADPRWSPAAARRIADALWADHELHEGHLAGVVHVITAG